MKYIKSSNMPPRMMLAGPILWWLFLDRIDAPGWAWGVMGALLGLLFCVDLFRLYACEAVDLLKDK